MKIAVIGAGAAGLSLARGISQFAPHWDLQIFEKSSFAGGRISTRITPEVQFDHGAPFFCARSKTFKSTLREASFKNLVGEWDGKKITREKGKPPEKRLWFEKHLVGIPAMRHFAVHLSSFHKVHYNSTVVSLTQDKKQKWSIQLRGSSSLELFDHVALCVPAPQALSLLPPSISFHAHVSAVKMHACFSLMLGGDLFKKDLPIFTKIRNSPIRWIVSDHLKPGRNKDLQQLVLYSDYQWADENINTPPSVVLDILKKELAVVLGEDMNPSKYEELHRWRYAALKSTPKKVPFLFDARHDISAAGDFCLGSSVDQAFQSGALLAKHLTQANLK